MTWTPKHQGEDLRTGFFHRQIHYSDDPNRDSEWVKTESIKYGGVNSAKWRREQEIDWNVFGGQRVWPMINRGYHSAIIDLNEDWAIYRILDHGIRHPTCCLWVGVNRRGDRHFFREYYATDKSIAINCRQILRFTDEEVIDSYIDPSTKKRINYVTTDANSEKKGLARIMDIYEENKIQCSLADNCAAGYDKVTDGLLSTMARHAMRTGQLPEYMAEMGINQDHLCILADKPSITFDLRFVPRAFNETENLRWKEITGDISQKSEPEKTVDVQDEGPDCVRYAMQSDLFWRRPLPKIQEGSYQDTLLKRLMKRRRQGYRKWA